MERNCSWNRKGKKIISFKNLSLLLLLFVPAALILFCLFTNSEMGIEAGSVLMSIRDEHENHLLQDSYGVKTMEAVKAKWESFVGVRRLLYGPGSSPPRCNSKCGRCTPCKPVHVPVPPGTPVTTEYYPEAWRCKCGNRLYMPSDHV